VQDSPKKGLAESALCMVATQVVTESPLVGRQRRLDLPALAVAAMREVVMEGAPTVTHDAAAAGSASGLHLDDGLDAPLLAPGEVRLGVVASIRKEDI
jgi:hypothetical protein